MKSSKEIELVSHPEYNPFSKKDTMLNGKFDFFIFSLGLFFDSKTLTEIASINHFFNKLSSTDQLWQVHIKRSFSSNSKPIIEDKSQKVINYKATYQQINMICIKLEKLSPKKIRDYSHSGIRRKLSELFIEIIKTDFDKYNIIFPWLLKKVIVDINKQLDPKSSQGTFLHVAAKAGNVYFVQTLLDYKASVNPISGGYVGGKWTKWAKGWGTTPLAYAARSGHADCVELLCKKKSYINYASKENGDTALHEAAREGHLECVKTLLKHNARTDFRGRFFCRPLAVAKDNCQNVIREKMKERGEYTSSLFL